MAAGATTLAQESALGPGAQMYFCPIPLQMWPPGDCWPQKMT